MIAVSEFTKRELVELLGTPPDKVTVIPNGVAEVFLPDGPAAEGDYVLRVGTLEPRKNLDACPGGGPAGRRRAARRRRARLGRRRGRGLAGPGLRRRARALYRGAHCVVYPSLYEGFGLPMPRRWPAARRS